MAPKPLEGGAFHDPSNTGPRHCHLMPQGGVFSIYASTRIAAPPQAVFDALVDIAHWKDWNTFVHDVKITSHPHPHHKPQLMMEGTNMTFSVRMMEGVETTSKETVTHIDKEVKTRREYGKEGKAVTHIAWDMHNAAMLCPGFLLKAQRTNELEDLGEEGTEYRSWETFGGMLAGGIKKKYGEALKERFAEMARELKEYVEGKLKSQVEAGGQVGASDAVVTEGDAVAAS